MGRFRYCWCAVALCSWTLAYADTARLSDPSAEIEWESKEVPVQIRDLPDGSGQIYVQLQARPKAKDSSVVYHQDVIAPKNGFYALVIPLVGQSTEFEFEEIDANGDALKHRCKLEWISDRGEYVTALPPRRWTHEESVFLGLPTSLGNETNSGSSNATLTLLNLGYLAAEGWTYRARTPLDRTWELHLLGSFTYNLPVNSIAIGPGWSVDAGVGWRGLVRSTKKRELTPFIEFEYERFSTLTNIYTYDSIQQIYLPQPQRMDFSALWLTVSERLLLDPESPSAPWEFVGAFSRSIVASATVAPTNTPLTTGGWKLGLRGRRRIGTHFQVGADLHGELFTGDAQLVRGTLVVLGGYRF